MGRNQRNRCVDLRWLSCGAIALLVAASAGRAATAHPARQDAARPARQDAARPARQDAARPATQQLGQEGVGRDETAEKQGHVFRNHFWVNLHHFLYLQAVTAERKGELDEAPPEWMEAVEFYRSTLISRDLLFDGGMRRIDELLGTVTRRGDLAGLDLPDGLAEILGNAGPLYLARFWPRHEKRNAEWIETTSALLAAHGTAVTDRLSELLVSQWPQAVLVDVLVYANWAGAFTSSGPDHIRVGTAFPTEEPPHEAFETFFHETSHLMVDTIGERIEQAARDAEMTVPRDLWHVILFFTVGELARRSPATPDDYVPYAERHGLYARGRHWAVYHTALVEHWMPYIDGKASMDAALDALLADLRRTSSEAVENH